MVRSRPQDSPEGVLPTEEQMETEEKQEEAEHREIESEEQKPQIQVITDSQLIHLKLDKILELLSQ
jgi:hypothetical protein